jgi:hypothetical protein
MNINLRFIDLCLPCYVQDHCNGENEMLLGIDADGATTFADVLAGLIDAFAHGDDKAPFDVTAFELVARQWFDGVDMATVWDYTPNEDADDSSEQVCAWFRLSWEA